MPDHRDPTREREITIVTCEACRRCLVLDRRHSVDTPSKLRCASCGAVTDLGETGGGEPTTNRME